MYALIALYPSGLSVKMFSAKLDMEHEHYNARHSAKRIAVGKIKKGATEESLRAAFTKDWGL
jgi:hypothetical protein